MSLFTTLAGTGQGLLLALVGVDWAARLGLLAPPGRAFHLIGAALVLMLCGIGLVDATFHLGHPLPAWRAVMMWRSSWLSREVIVLPAFMAVVALWGGLQWLGGAPSMALAALASLLAVGLFICTGMIYAAVTECKPPSACATRASCKHIRAAWPAALATASSTTAAARCNCCNCCKRAGALRFWVSCYRLAACC